MARLHRVASACCATISLVSLVLLRAEVMASVPLSGSELEIMLTVGGDQSALTPAPSMVGRYMQMQSCLQVEEGQVFAVFAKDQQQRVAGVCGDLADRILARAPSLSIAHTVRAASHWRLGETVATFADLETAQRLAPSTGFLAQHRLQIAFGAASAARGVTPDPFAPDLVLVAQNYRNSGGVAALYLGYPAWQAWMLAILAQQPAATQQMFLRHVEISMRASVGP